MCGRTLKGGPLALTTLSFFKAPDAVLTPLPRVPSGLKILFVARVGTKQPNHEQLELGRLHDRQIGRLGAPAIIKIGEVSLDPLPGASSCIGEPGRIRYLCSRQALNGQRSTFTVVQ
jgi:hypothetical protein